MKLEIENLKLKIPAKQRGMTLFIAVTVMGILLFISFAVVNIALKSMLFSSSGRDSQLAFYAADAGLECAIYWDSMVDPSKFDPTLTGGSIDCAGSTLSGDGLAGSTAITGTSTILTKIGGSGGTVVIARVNAGGSSYTDPISGNVWSADSNYSGGNNSVLATSNSIANTLDDPLYQDQRMSGDGAINALKYTFTGLADGQYNVKLKWAEIWYPSRCTINPKYPSEQPNPWTRIQSVKINGATVENSLHVVQQVGCFTALDKDYPVNVSGGSITIEFIPLWDKAFISAIEITTVATGGTDPSAFGFVMDQANPAGPCAIVTVTKNGGATSIYSRGYNTCDTSNPRRIERGVEVTY